MSQSRIDLLSSAYQAFNRRDADGVLRFMVPDVEWPNMIEHTRLRGHDQVRAYWGGQWATIRPRVEPVGFDELQDGRVAVHVHQTVRDLEGNLLLDQMVDHIYTFDGDWITRMDVAESSR